MNLRGVFIYYSFNSFIFSVISEKWNDITIHLAFPPGKLFRISCENWRFMMRDRWFIICIIVITSSSIIFRATNSTNFRNKTTTRWHVFSRIFSITRLSFDNQNQSSNTNWRWEKHKKGGLNCIRSKNTKIQRQKYISPKSEASHGPCQMWHGRATSQDCLLLLLLLVQATY